MPVSGFKKLLRCRKKNVGEQEEEALRLTLLGCNLSARPDH